MPNFDELKDSLSSLPSLSRDLKDLYLKVVGKPKFDPKTGLPKWYDMYEAEAVVYLIAPLLKCLGWSPKRMAFEFYLRQTNKYPDIALFTQSSRKPEHITALVEAKHANHIPSIEKAPPLWTVEHHFDLVSASVYPSLNRIIATDGIRYFVFVKDKDGSFKPDKYLCFDLDKCFNDDKGKQEIDEARKKADEALRIMSADWSPN